MEETTDEKIARLQKDKDDREKRRDEERKARDAQALELEAKFETELGPRGVKFDLLTTELGIFVVKLGDFVAHKRFNSKGKDVSEEDVFALIMPSIVHPDPFTAKGILKEHAGIAWDLAVLMQDLYRAKGRAQAGK